MIRHNKPLSFFEQRKNNSQKLITESNHCFSVLHSLTSFFHVVSSKMIVMYHDSSGHQVKITPERSGSLFTDSTMPVQASSGLSNRRVSTRKSNETAFCFESIDASDFSNKVGSCNITNTFNGTDKENYFEKYKLR